MPMTNTKEGEAPADDALKERLFKGVCSLWFIAVVAHTLNLQSESILFRNACKNDLAKASKLVANSNAAAGVLGVIVNQFGGKLSDSLGRKPFYLLGPCVQILTGLLAYSHSTNPMVLAIAKTFRMVATTFSGTVMGTVGLRDVFPGQEMAVRMVKAGSVIGIAIMCGPLSEAVLLRRAGVGGEKVTYLATASLGLTALCLNTIMLPETLPEIKRRELDVRSAIAAANPFGFFKIYTHGSPLLKRVATIATMQTMIDGKNMSDLGMIWMREHLNFSIESIRNFVMGYGLFSMVAMGKLIPAMLKSMSASRFTALTNFTNWLAFTIRGSAETKLNFYASFPIMLPGVNGASNSALLPIVNKEMAACGFGVGESTAWFNNLRVMAGVIATLMIGNCYAYCNERRLHAGTPFILAGLMGAALPQMLLMSTVDKALLEDAPKKAK